VASKLLDSLPQLSTQDELYAALRFHRGVLRAGHLHQEYERSVFAVSNLRRLDRFLTLRQQVAPHALFDATVTQVALRHGISRTDILGKCHKRHFADARSELVVILHDPPHRWSYKYIGKWLNRDHTTIINLYERRSRDPRLCRCGRARESERKCCWMCREQARLSRQFKAKPPVKINKLLVGTLLEVRSAWVRLDTVRQFEAWLYETTTAALAGADDQMTQEQIDSAIVEIADRIQERRRVELASRPRALRSVSNG
jgi:hypothetical protein